MQGKFKNSGRVNSPFPHPAITAQSADEAFELVLENAGAVFPKRDSVDIRIIQEVRSGTETYGGVWGARSGIIDSQIQVGGWPELKNAEALKDSDADGMPDLWEEKHGLNPENSNDRNDDQNQDGYTNLENYLNELVSAFESQRN